jgi:hypothetical protein
VFQWLFKLILSLLLGLFLSGCQVGTNSSKNIPEASNILESSGEYKLLKDTSEWGKNMEPKPIFESEKADGFKSYRAMVEIAGREFSAIVANWFYKDDDKRVDVFALNPNSYRVDMGSLTDDFTEVAFREYNSSQRAVFLSAELEDKTQKKRLKIWLAHQQVEPEGSYIDDVVLNDKIYSLYRDKDNLTLVKKEPTLELKVVWQELLKVLVAGEFLEDEKSFSVGKISFGFEIGRGSELFVIEKFTTTSTLK